MSQIGEAFVRVRPDVSGFRADTQQAVTRDMRRVEAGLASSNRELGRFTRGALVGSGALGGLGRSAAFASSTFVGGAGLVFALRSTLKAATDTETTAALLQHALDQLGISFARNRPQIEASVDSLSKLAGIDTAELNQSFTMFVRRTHDVTEALRLNAIAADLARAKHMSFASAAQLVLKASQGNEGALRRAGIQAAKNSTGLQLLDTLQRKYAGSAEAYGQTAAGAQDRFRIAVAATQSAIGEQLLPTLSDLLNRGTEWLNDSENQARIQRDVAAAVEQASQAVHGLAAGVGAVNDVLGPVVNSVGGLTHAIELLLAAMALNKLSVFVRGVGLLGPAATAATAEVAGLEAAAARSSGGMARGAAASTRFSGVLRLGLEAAALKAGYEIGQLGIKALGLEGPLRAAGGFVADLAAKVGLLGNEQIKIPVAGFGPDIQAKLIDAYKQAVRAIPGDGALAQEARDKFVQNLVGPDFTFHDAQVFADHVGDAAHRAHEAGAAALAQPVLPAVLKQPFAGKTVSAGQQRAIDLARAGTTTPTDDDVKALNAELAAQRQRIAFAQQALAEHRGNEQEFANQLADALGQEETLQGRLKTIADQRTQAAQEAADAAKQRAAEAAAARAEASQAEEQELNNVIASVGRENVNNKRLQTAEAQLTALLRGRANDQTLTRGERAAAQGQLLAETQQETADAKAFVDRQAELVRERQELARAQQELQLQTIQNTAAAAELIADPAKRYEAERAADEKMVEALRLAAADKTLTAAEYAQANAAYITAQVTLNNLIRAHNADVAAQAKQAQADQAAIAGQTLQNAVARAGLTSGTRDDVKAQQAIVSYWHKQVEKTKGLERLQAQGQELAAKAALKAIKRQKTTAKKHDALVFANSQDALNEIARSRKAALVGNAADAKASVADLIRTFLQTQRQIQASGSNVFSGGSQALVPHGSTAAAPGGSHFEGPLPSTNRGGAYSPEAQFRRQGPAARSFQVTVNQHFPHPPTPDGQREMRYANHAAKAAFDGGF